MMEIREIKFPDSPEEDDVAASAVEVDKIVVNKLMMLKGSWILASSNHGWVDGGVQRLN